MLKAEVDPAKELVHTFNRIIKYSERLEKEIKKFDESETEDVVDEDKQRVLDDVVTKLGLKLKELRYDLKKWAHLCEEKGIEAHELLDKFSSTVKLACLTFINYEERTKGKAFLKDPFTFAQSDNGENEIILVKNWTEERPDIFNEIKTQFGPTCYAYSSVSLCETIYAMDRRENIELSEQHLLDSIPALKGERSVMRNILSGNCQSALKHIRSNGLSLEKDYPNELRDRDCVAPAVPPQGTKYTIDRYQVRQNTLNVNMLVKLVDSRPIIGVVTSSKALHDLKKGCIYEGPYDPEDVGVSHAMVIVGHGYLKKDGRKVLLVKNTWGRHWCSRGYGFVLASLVKRAYWVTSVVEKL